MTILKNVGAKPPLLMNTRVNLTCIVLPTFRCVFVAPLLPILLEKGGGKFRFFCFLQLTWITAPPLIWTLDLSTAFLKTTPQGVILKHKYLITFIHLVLIAFLI